MTEPQSTRICPTCKMRQYLPRPVPRALYGPLDIDRKAYHWLENAAAMFDAESDELFTAAEFVAWIRADLAWVPIVHAEFDGAPPRTLAGTPTTARSGKEVHRHPFPLPTSPRR